MMLHDLHYAWPWAANLILLLPVFVFLFVLLYRYRRKILQINNFQSSQRSYLSYVLRTSLFLIAWVAALLALMQPLANGHYPEVKRPKKAEANVRKPSHEVIILVDASASMEVADMYNGQTRLQFVNQLADEFVSNLDGEQVSLYAFTAQLTPMAPPTLDYLFIRLMLNQIHINEDGVAGTDFLQTLIELQKRLMQTPMAALKTVLIFTDGVDTSAEASLLERKNDQEVAVLKLVGDYLKLNARVFTIGLGTSQGGVVPDVTYKGQAVIGKLDSSLLKQIANTGHGKYLEANDYTVLESARILADEVNALSKGAQGQDINNSVEIGQELPVYEHYYQYPLSIAIAALLAALLLPGVRKAAVTALLLLYFPLEARDIRPAEVMFESHEYAKAVGILEQLKTTEFKTWQNQTMLFDQGTIYLTESKWDQAIATFLNISEDREMSPVLFSAWKINLGIAFLEKARSLSSLAPPPYAIILNLQSEAIKAFQFANSKEMTNTDSSLLIHLASIVHASTTQKSLKWTVTESPLQEALSLLLLNLTNLQVQIRFLDREWKLEKLKSEYIQLVLDEQGSWKPIWERENKIDPNFDAKTAGDEHALYQEGYADYLKTLKLLSAGSWSESLQNLEESTQKIIAAMRLQFSKNPSQDLLQRLLSHYRRVLNQVQMSEGALMALKNEQAQVEEIFTSNEMKKSMESLVASASSLKERKPAASHFFLENAQEWIHRALFELQEMTPKEILEELISRQAFAGRMLLLKMHLGSTEKIPAFWQEAQEDVAVLTSQFLPIVLEKQKHVYRDEKAENRCQAHPWDQVLTNFEEGRLQAKQAQQALAGDAFKKALTHEGRAIVAWQQALTALQKPVMDSSSPCQAKPQKESQGKPEEASTKPEQKPATPNEVLRVLQELNEDDQLPKTDHGIKKGPQPW